MNYFKSSIGRKHIMGITGLGLSLFVLAHMAGNLLLLLGREAYNHYSYLLINNKLIYVAETGLATLFIVHFIMAFALAIKNRRARPDRYYRGTNGAKAVSPASKTMIFHGTILLAFTIWHLITFKYGRDFDDPNLYYWITPGTRVRDLYTLAIQIFQDPLFLGAYFVCMILLGVHLSHGFQSSFQSVGVYHPRYTPVLKYFGFFYAVIVAAGFVIPPVAIFFGLIH